jgi:hypothetical protein
MDSDTARSVVLILLFTIVSVVFCFDLPYGFDIGLATLLGIVTYVTWFPGHTCSLMDGMDRTTAFAASLLSIVLVV